MVYFFIRPHHHTHTASKLPEQQPQARQNHGYHTSLLSPDPRCSTLSLTSVTRSSSAFTFPFTTVSLSAKLFSTPSTARSSSSSALLTLRCSSSRPLSVLSNAAALVCNALSVRSRVRIWGICGSSGDKRVRTGVSWSWIVGVDGGGGIPLVETDKDALCA